MLKMNVSLSRFVNYLRCGRYPKLVYGYLSIAHIGDNPCNFFMPNILLDNYWHNCRFCIYFKQHRKEYFGTCKLNRNLVIL